MEPQINFEGIHIVWSIAFLIDVANGFLFMYAVLKGLHRRGLEPFMWWVGWWYFFDAITLIINEVLGPLNPFSYHQFGIVTGIAIYGGITAYMVRTVYINWYMTPTDWDQIEKIAKNAALRHYTKEADND
mgnify:CR=1 FL=1